MNPPQQIMQSQGKNPNLPQQSVHSKNQGMTPPQQVMQSQSKNLNPPQQSVHSQHHGMIPQQQSIQTPNKNMNSTQQSAHSQNPGMNPQIHNEHSQHHGMNPQQQTIPSPNKNINSQQQNVNSHQPNQNPQQQNMIPPSQIKNTHQVSQQNVNQPQQSIKAPNQSMIPQKQSIQNPNLIPKNIQPISQQDTNIQENNNTVMPETQNPNIIQKESADRIQKKNSLRTSRNKSPPQILRTKDGQFQRAGVDTSGNHYYITTENDTVPSDSYICSNLNEYLDKEIMTQKSIHEKPKNNKSGSGFRFYGQLTKAGRKQNGETKVDQDTPLVHLNVGGIPGFNLFGVLDGHGPEGHFVSQFCRDYFINKMNYYAEICKQNGLKTPEDIFNELKRTKYAYIIQIFTQADTEIALQSFDYWFSGTTCNITFQFNKNLVNASVGDSRSILVFDGGDNQLQGIQPLSTDHKPDIPCELNRILSKGGFVDQITGTYGEKVGPKRVWKAGQNYPGLAMSRSLGDFHAKECGVIAYPQIVVKTIDKLSKYLVICSDGVWEFIQNEQVRDLGNVFFKKNDVGGFCSDLVKFAVHSWENFDIIRDDITVVCVYF
jgi:serine/threonine protein phosphatase PrpC